MQSLDEKRKPRNTFLPLWKTGVWVCLTHFILMEFPMHVERISMKLYIFCFNGIAGQNFYKMMFFLICGLKIDFIFGNSSDPDEMPQYAAFYQGLHCLPKYLFNMFAGIKNEKGLICPCCNFQFVSLGCIAIILNACLKEGNSNLRPVWYSNPIPF